MAAANTGGVADSIVEDNYQPGDETNTSPVEENNQPSGAEETPTSPDKNQPAAAETTPKPGTRPYEEMLKSTAYGRLRSEHPTEFEPASVFFTHDAGSAIDRRNSLRVKAALVYEAVTGRHADDDHMPRATRLLLTLAEKCHSKIHSSSQANKDAPAPQADVGGNNAGGTATGTGTGDAADDAPAPQTDAGGNAGGTGKGKGTGAGAGARTGIVGAADEAGWDGNKMLVLDGIFLVVGFLPKLNEFITTRNADRDSVDQSFKTRHMVEMVTDVIKLENQLLRLQDLLDVARVIKDVLWETVDGDEQAGFQFKDVKKSMTDRQYKPEVTVQNLGDVIHRFCWYYSPFSSSATTKAAVLAAAPADSPFKDIAGKPEMGARTLLDCLHMSVVKQPAHGKKGTSLPGGPARMPTARDLRRSGVRIQASSDDDGGRAEIEFAERTATVTLPALVFDFKLATVARNLLAREYEEEQSKPLTRYFQMMNEVVEEAADVRILRRAGVIRGGSRGGQEVQELVKNIDGHATYPSVYMAMDREIDKVREYHDKRMANFFVRNRPSVIWASSVAAVSVAAIVATRRKRG